MSLVRGRNKVTCNQIRRQREKKPTEMRERRTNTKADFVMDTIINWLNKSVSTPPLSQGFLKFDTFCNSKIYFTKSTTLHCLLILLQGTGWVKRYFDKRLKRLLGAHSRVKIVWWRVLIYLYNLFLCKGGRNSVIKQDNGSLGLSCKCPGLVIWGHMFGAQIFIF